MSNKNPSIGVIDHNYANIHSVVKALDYLKVKHKIIKKADDINNVEAIILPGVGSFDAAMESLNNNGFTNEIKEASKKNLPIMGVCLGMQLLFEKSDEGSLAGIGIVKGEVIKINVDNTNLKIPHMGWNKTTKCHGNTLMDGIENDTYFYYVHGYKCIPHDESIMTSFTTYSQKICSSIEVNSIFGTQFHPEKSGMEGINVYKNFISKLKEL